jgi:hypothetical protein
VSWSSPLDYENTRFSRLAQSIGAEPYRAIAPQELISKARDAANKAMELGDTLAESYLSLASIEISYDRDWTRAGTQLKRALELNPGDADAHYVRFRLPSAAGQV